MASTNKTTHYELSQYVSSDKPTYLVDYNGDMAKIDTGINAAKTTADTASTAATNAQTAAEGAQTTANTAVTNAATAQTTADGANTKIGTLANLETVEKTDLVGAINEVNTKATTSEVVDTTVGSETNKAPSVHAMKQYLYEALHYGSWTTLYSSGNNIVKYRYNDINLELYIDLNDVHNTDVNAGTLPQELRPDHTYKVELTGTGLDYANIFADGRVVFHNENAYAGGSVFYSLNNLSNQ